MTKFGEGMRVLRLFAAFRVFSRKEDQPRWGVADQGHHPPGSPWPLPLMQKRCDIYTDVGRGLPTDPRVSAKRVNWTRSPLKKMLELGRRWGLRFLQTRSVESGYALTVQAACY